MSASEFEETKAESYAAGRADMLEHVLNLLKQELSYCITPYNADPKMVFRRLINRLEKFS